MSKEEFYEPIEAEVNRAVASAKKQMKEYRRESQPTPENVNRVMREVAAQFGEKFEAGDTALSEEDIVEKHREEGWKLVEVVTNAAKMTASRQEGKEIKIVGLGEKFLIFEKEKKE